MTSEARVEDETVDEGSRAGDGSVQSVARALTLLELLATAREPLGISDLCKATNLPAATIHRLLATLVSYGYARRDPETRKYASGVGLVRLDATAGHQFGAWTEPYLLELVDHSGETTSIAVLQADEVVYIRQVPSPHAMRMSTEVGRRSACHATGAGKVLLAFQPREVLRRLTGAGALLPYTDRTITDPEELAEELEQVGAAGYAFGDEEEERGVLSVAVPVFASGRPVAALNIAGPTSRFTRADAEAIVPAMHRVSAQLSATLMAEEHGAPEPGHGAGSTRRPSAP
ncbi:IclR family transcriptional regulator [Egibacter rhizosphaerae]|uniref:Glycerol operon regulatory protein n=1 Tax=Egibacter rhizosphaerae TaxID=1670831 RepID=A0A411YJR1_9ACTN|nr:IclR family transcriptional regulator [Egibacter rhizosphaerae]QBI21438.1 IclR family transcriptional regulator [Egibacter rhizosphaerae]